MHRTQTPICCQPNEKESEGLNLADKNSAAESRRNQTRVGSQKLNKCLVGVEGSKYLAIILENAGDTLGECGELRTGRQDLVVYSWDKDRRILEECLDLVWVAIRKDRCSAVGSSRIIAERDGDAGEGALGGDGGWCCGDGGSEKGKDDSECGLHFDG